MTILIDGDNTFRALNLIRGSELAPVEQFLQQLESAAVSKDWEVVVVCDGPERYFPRESGPLVVRYAPPKQTADTFIERLVYQASDRSAVVVVTRDRAEENLVLGFGARVWTPQRMLEEIREAPV